MWLFSLLSDLLNLQHKNTLSWNKFVLGQSTAYRDF